MKCFPLLEYHRKQIAFNSHKFPMTIIVEILQKQKQMKHLEILSLHQNDVTLQMSKIKKSPTLNQSNGAFTAWSTQDVQRKTVSDIQNPAFSTNLERPYFPPFSDDWTLKTDIKDYLLQTTFGIDKKLILKTASEIITDSPGDQRLSWAQKARLQRLKTEFQTVNMDFPPSVRPFILKAKSTVLTGKFLIFIAQKSTKPGYANITIWSLKGEVLLLLYGIPSNCVSQAAIFEMAQIRSCFCIFINNSLDDGSLIKYVDCLCMGFNEVIAELPNSSFCQEVFSYSFLTPDGRQMWVIFSNDFRYVLSSQAMLSLFLSGNFSQLQKLVTCLIGSYYQQIGGFIKTNSSYEIRSAVLALVNNMNQIQKAKGGVSDTMTKLWQLIEILGEGLAKTSDQDNQELLDKIGNHYPEKKPHCLKCRACKKNNKVRGKKNDNCKKSKYVCEGCSIYFKEKIHLCVVCFKKFHKKIRFFMEIKAKSETKKPRTRVNSYLRNKRLQKQKALKQRSKMTLNSNEVDTKESNKPSVDSQKTLES